MDEQWRTTPLQEVLEVQRIIDVACEACRKAENAGLLSRGRLRRAAARTVAEQSELLRRTAPWLKDAEDGGAQRSIQVHLIAADVILTALAVWAMRNGR